MTNLTRDKFKLLAEDLFKKGHILSNLIKDWQSSGYDEDYLKEITIPKLKDFPQLVLKMEPMKEMNVSFKLRQKTIQMIVNAINLAREQMENVFLTLVGAYELNYLDARVIRYSQQLNTTLNNLQELMKFLDNNDQ
jgi:hypothetical protein